eukprot:353848-Chlamydomonas_euryale.AAC.3
MCTSRTRTMPGSTKTPCMPRPPILYSHHRHVLHARTLVPYACQSPPHAVLPRPPTPRNPRRPRLPAAHTRPALSAPRTPPHAYVPRATRPAHPAPAQRCVR